MQPARIWKFVQCDGGIWRMTRKAYARMHREIKETGGVKDLDAYGSLIVPSYEHLSDIINEDNQ